MAEGLYGEANKRLQKAIYNRQEHGAEITVVRYCSSLDGGGNQEDGVSSKESGEHSQKLA